LKKESKEAPQGRHPRCYFAPRNNPSSFRLRHLPRRPTLDFRPRTSNNKSMPRTFSLARLLLALTAIAIFCGLAVAFPVHTLLASIPASPIVICLTMLPFTRQPAGLFASTLVGALTAFTLPFLFPPMFDPLFDTAHARLPPSLGGGKTFLEGGLLAGFFCLSVLSAFGALLAGGAFLLVEHLLRPKITQPDAPTS